MFNWLWNLLRDRSKVEVKLRITRDGMPYYDYGKEVRIPADRFYKYFPEEHARKLSERGGNTPQESIAAIIEDKPVPEDEIEGEQPPPGSIYLDKLPVPEGARVVSEVYGKEKIVGGKEAWLPIRVNHADGSHTEIQYDQNPTKWSTHLRDQHEYNRQQLTR